MSSNIENFFGELGNMVIAQSYPTWEEMIRNAPIKIRCEALEAKLSKWVMLKNPVKVAIYLRELGHISIDEATPSLRKYVNEVAIPYVKTHAVVENGQLVVSND